jgi:sarcosine oxidase subunit gamma
MVKAFADMMAPAAVNIRGAADDTAFASVVENLLGLALPRIAGGVARAGSRRLVWLGPDEWLLLDEDGDAAATEAALVDALAGQHVSVCDVSGNRAMIRLAAKTALAILSRGCALDLEAQLAGSGCVQTMLARAQILIVAEPDGTIDIFPRRSFAGYVQDWLAAATIRHAA